MPRSIMNGQGYYLNDNRASGGKLEESDIVGCSHCQKLMKKPDWKENGGYCMACEQPLCVDCVKTTRVSGCARFINVIEQKLEDKYRRDQNARMLGT